MYMSVYNTDWEKSFLIGEPMSWAAIREENYHREWVWEGYIAKGHITLLSALWKAGKSTFLRCLFLALKNEEEFAGQPTKKSNVLVISEEAAGDWASEREELADDDIKNIYVWVRPIRVKPNLKQWLEFINATAKKCDTLAIDCVIIDTVSTFWPIDNENDAAHMMQALIPLYTLTEKNIAVVLVHHFRKGGGDQAQASRGSGAFPGFVDNIIEFTRSDDGFVNDRILKTYGRFDEVVPTVVIRYMPDGKYITLGDPINVSKFARIQRIVSILTEASTPLSIKEIHNIWVMTTPTISLRTLQRYIKDLVTTNVLIVAKETTVAGKVTPLYAVRLGYTEQEVMDFLTDDKINTPSQRG